MKDFDEKKMTRKTSEIINFNKEINVADLSFRYPDNSKNVFTKVNFKIPKGKFVGIVGPSGAGKTIGYFKILAPNTNVSNTTNIYYS